MINTPKSSVGWSEPGKIHYATTRMVTDQLTDSQLAALNNTVTADFDPKTACHWPKSKALFSQRLSSGKLTAHDETKRMISIIVNERLVAPKIN